MLPCTTGGGRTTVPDSKAPPRSGTRAATPLPQLSRPAPDEVRPVALENGRALREWVEGEARAAAPTVIRCATYTATRPGLRWLRRLSRTCKDIRVLCDTHQAGGELAALAASILGEDATVRVMPARPGATVADDGSFHAKLVILDDSSAVIGSANLTGSGLGIGPGPSNVEVAIGLSGRVGDPAVAQLVECFDQWWEEASTPRSATRNEKENEIMAEPEYVVFSERLHWGVAQVQTDVEPEGALFGSPRWLAIADIPSGGPEGTAARVPAQSERVAAAGPVPWLPPAKQVADGSTLRYTKGHFSRLAAYWLQAENRQGQLDSLPVLEMRHQTSLVEYLASADAPRQMLIADEVGLGKTIELALLLARLLAADPNLRVLYVTLGGLVTNVVDEFKDMGVGDVYVYANRSLDERSYPPARLGSEKHDAWVVASLNRLGIRDNAARQLLDTTWDVVIADECHRLRMYGGEDSQNAQKWFRVVEDVIDGHLAKDGRVYFLSGTPHQGNKEVFLNLVAMMCRLGRDAPADAKERALAGRVIYRTKDDIVDWDGNPVFPNREVRDPHLATTPPEYHELLRDIGGFFDWLAANGERDAKQGLGFAKSNALQYAASSPKAGFAFLLRRFLRYCDDGTTPDSRLHAWTEALIPYRDYTTSKPNNLLAALRKTVDRRDETDDEEVGPAARTAVRDEERNRLVRLLQRYTGILSGPEATSKFDVLMDLVDEADEPFVVFAMSVDTVYEVKRYLEKRGVDCYLIVGGQDASERRKAINGFTGDDHLGRRVLVSSAAGGEGINLQAARRLVHFDLPWNPMVLEQRIGRVHRVGSVNTILVDTILLAGSRESDIYTRLLERLYDVVTALASDPTEQQQYFRRVMASVPLETLRVLYGGEVADDNNLIAQAVEAGRDQVIRVEEELASLHKAQLPEERGRATMNHLVELLERSGKVELTPQKVQYQTVVFDEQTQSFGARSVSVKQYAFRDGRSREARSWVVFDREAAALSQSVARANSGGIDHDLTAIALQNLRTPPSLERMRSLAIGVGRFDREYLELLSDGADGPVVILSYVSARLMGEHYFNHALRLYAISRRGRTELDRDKEADLIEEIIWSNLRCERPPSALSRLDPELERAVVEEDIRIREELTDDVRNDQGHWLGAVWPIAATALVAR